ncbi:histidine phosphatase family protein [Couchioplanes caeruleus]|uniref:histidine phosphatase family protein n=1 Tax=Couchioplanes caeruleus TaxID=56438 RepID=UPI0020BF5EE3|nr:histidine phosphatase family protein [Couchioplanes caeruleus]UQU63523.1 histidine phosphatase family protein [Couchioplanes caeruleus]
MTARYLYLARHGDAVEGGGLTPAGRRQAECLAERLADVPLTSITHSPLRRATETAAILAPAAAPLAVPPGATPTAPAATPPVSAAVSPVPAATPPVPAAAPPVPVAWDGVGDYVPYVPDPVPPAFEALFEGWTAEELAAGPRLAAQALDRFAGPFPDGVRHDLVVTHAFAVAWFVRDALQAPPERWLGLNAANCALTVIRYSEGRPPGLLVFNDMSHLPAELRWTGFPSHLRVSS